jgi:hypothetical protein
MFSHTRRACVSKQTGKGSRHQRRASALERKATQHHDFVGGADAERAQAEAQKRERLATEENREVVREMAAELEQAAGIKGDGAAGPEFPVRIPRSIEEAKEIVREAPEALREKARERMRKLPDPAQKALGAASTIAGMLLAPVRLGLHIAREVVRIPFSVFRTLRDREA